jgi:hypothetical protein
MRNRKLSEYIFYGILVVITLIVYLLRVSIVGGQRELIDQTDHENIALQAQIDELNELVQSYKDYQTSHLYDLYDIIPNDFSAELLTYKTVWMLESIGINESENYNRSVTVKNNFNPTLSSLADVYGDYTIVRVDVSFTTDDVTQVEDFIDILYQSEQLFILEAVDYTDTKGEYLKQMNISFLAIYDLNKQSES